jgi:hypothetical protein
MATCSHCERTITLVRDCSTTPEGSGDGISGGTWICPEYDMIFGISEVESCGQPATVQECSR